MKTYEEWKYNSTILGISSRGQYIIKNNLKTCTVQYMYFHNVAEQAEFYLL
jgi:hypothetical protein